MIYLLSEKFTYLYFLVSLSIGKIYVRLLKIFTAGSKSNNPQKDFLFFPYTHKDNSGTNSRYQEYFPFLDKDGFTYDIHYIATMQHYDWVYHIPKKSKAREYLFYNRIFWQRLNWILKARNYKSVFFQRALFPDYYNQKHEILESLLHKLHNNVTVDYFDADYVRDENYIKEIIGNCNKVSVVNETLYNFFSKHHPKVLYNDLSIDIKRYKQKENFSIHNPVRIFWTGGVGNAINLKLILPVLEKINKTIPLKLVMVCKNKAGYDYSFIEQYPWEENTYVDYMIGSDIAVYPALEDDEYSRGKVAYKALEYAAVKIPIIASSQGLTSRFEHEKDAMIANTIEDWEKYFIRLNKDEALRKLLAHNAFDKLKQYHDVSATYKNFIEILQA